MLLTKAVNGAEESLGDVVGEPEQHRLLTEFELNNDGFGSPDNGLFIRSGTRNSFVFIEGKAVPLRASWKKPPHLPPEDLGDLTDDVLDKMCRKNDFNSSINGQLEMRWRFVNAFRAAHSRNQMLVTEDLAPPATELMENDRFYWRRRYSSQHGIESDWRRVSMRELAPLWDMFGDVTDFYLMAVTDDEKRPHDLDTVRIFDNEQRLLEDLVSRVFWMPFRELANLLEEVPRLKENTATLGRTEVVE